MKEFREILTFYYKGKEYKMYLDNKNKKFFTGIIDDVETYIPVEEYVDLLMLFAKKEGVMNIEDDELNKMMNEGNNYNYNRPVEKKKKKRIVPKVIAGGLAILLTSSTLVGCLDNYKEQQAFKERILSPRTTVEEEYVVNSSTTASSEKETTNDYERYFTGGQADEEFILDTYIDNRDFSNRLYVYDMEYADLAFDYEQPSLDDFIQLINSNSSIDERFKPIMIEYCKDLFEKYPNVEKRQFYKNLQTLSVVEVDEQEMMKATINVDAVGCYVQDENRIYLLEGHEYEPGTWDYQVIYHELSHCMRDSQFKDKDGNQVYVKFCGLNYWDIPNAEAINSLFAVSLFDYEEKDIAYQYQSNYHKLLIECMDNYTLDDYVNHSLSYYAQQLDKYNGDDNYATSILALMETQYRDFHSSSFEAPQTEYYPVYDYVSKMYLGKHLNSNMSYEQARAVMDEMLEQLLFDVPEEYNIDTNHFYEYLNEYCQSIGIEVNQNIK